MPRPQKSKSSSTAAGRHHSAAVLPWCLAASVVTFLVFLPVLAHDFVNWDDNLNFLTNLNYRGLGPEQLRWMWTTFHMGPYQPLAWLSLGLDYTLWGMDARGYHLTSLVLHAINAGLFVAVAFALYRRMGRERRGTDQNGFGIAVAALAAGLFFAIHPQRVESVAWVTERRDVVSGFFLLLSLLAWLAERRGLALALFAASLLGKATGVTLPVALLVLDVYPLRRFQGGPGRLFAPGNRHLWIEKLPWFALALVAGIVAVIGQERSGALKSVDTFGVVERVGLTLYATGFYLYKMVAPVALSPLYEMREDFNAFDVPAVLFPIGAVGLAAALILFRRRWPAGLAAFAAYFVLIAPLSGAARAGHQLAADRYTYMATMPWALVAGAGFLFVPARFRKPALAATVSLGVALAVLTFVQSRIWRDSVSLWTHASQVDPRSEKSALNRASALVAVERLAEAEAIYRERIAANPAQGDARYSLGMVLYLSGRMDQAVEEFRRLVVDQPSFAMGYYGLGIMFMEQNRPADARRELETALRLEPRLVLARQALEQLAAGGS
jgi:tetratricopeptide (TPR) repeat protein